jgi:hypothetical protein
LSKRGAIVVHTLDQARAAIGAAAEGSGTVALLSARGAAGALGPLAFKAMIAEAHASHPDVVVTAVLDCSDAAGHALAALRAGVRCIRVEAAVDVRERLRDIARQNGADLYDNDAPVLDLLDLPDPGKACRDWLS